MLYEWVLDEIMRNSMCTTRSDRFLGGAGSPFWICEGFSWFEC